jgi:hypothetical protein
MEYFGGAIGQGVREVVLIRPHQPGDGGGVAEGGDGLDLQNQGAVQRLQDLINRQLSYT